MQRLYLVAALGAFLSGAPSGLTAELPQVIDVWPGQAPGEIGNFGPEKVWDKRPDGKPIPGVAGKPVKWLTNVSKPTLTIYRPAKDKDTGVELVIMPGGGLTYLAWDAEGEEVAAWLNKIGITGIILKYRVPRRPDQMEPKFKNIWADRPLQDAQRAMRLVRSKAKEWNLDPQRIGMVGFSAGAYLVVMTGSNFDQRLYEPIDTVDQVRSRPDFVVALYPGGGAAASRDKRLYALTPEVRLRKECPPMFFCAARDDGDKVDIITCMHQALKEAGVPTELRVYATGGHDFGLRPSKEECTTWPQRCEEWLHARGVLKPGRPDR